MRRGGDIALLLATVVAGLALAGCVNRWPSLKKQTIADRPAPTGAALRMGFGWSAASQPADAAREAVRAALAPLGRTSPDIVFVWDNWRSREEAQSGLAAINRLVDAFAVYGGHVAWPVTASSDHSPAVAVVALGGGWGAAATSVGGFAGREDEAAGTLVDVLNLGPRAAGAPGKPPMGLAAVVFGELSGRRGDRLIAELAKRVDSRAVVFGGGGGGAAGSGWQYVGGKLVHERVWAVRLAGPFRASAIQLTAEADADAIAQACSLATAILEQDVGRANTARSLVLMSVSTGWLACTPSPESLPGAVAERFVGESIVGGWAGETQAGPEAKTGALALGRFHLAMTLLAPMVPPTGPHTRPTTAPE